MHHSLSDHLQSGSRPKRERKNLMHRKIHGICAALLAFGAVLIGPASALAVTHLVDAGGNVKVGALIKGIGGGANSAHHFTFKGEGLEMTCNENYLTGSLHKAENPVELTITAGAFDSNLNASGTDCKSNLGATRVTLPQLEKTPAEHWCLVSSANDTFNFFGRSCTTEGNGKLTFILDNTPLGIQCAYVREAALTGTFKTGTLGAEQTTQLKVTGEPVINTELPSNSLCPATEKIVSMTFGLYTDTESTSSTLHEKTTNWDRAADTADPIWIEP
jgi:hypothetical protein